MSEPEDEAPSKILAESISDHALVRYIERIKGVSLDEYRREIEALLDQAEPPENKNENGLEDGIVNFVFDREGRLVTILPPQFRPQKKCRDRTLVRRAISDKTRAPPLAPTDRYGPDPIKELCSSPPIPRSER